MVEAQFLFELLMGLLANPTGFDGGSECLEISIGRQVRDVIFAFPGRLALSDNPHFITGHSGDAFVENTVFVAISDADTPSRKAAREWSLRAAPPA